LGAVLLGLSWIAAEVRLEGDTAIEHTPSPEWRRTSDGWIKVGHHGAAALDRPNPQRAKDPSLHPAIVSIFMLLSGVLALSFFDRHQPARLCPTEPRPMRQSAKARH
jgi:hypothetical protein